MTKLPLNLIKKLGSYLILIFCIGLVIGFIKNSLSLLQGDEGIIEAEKELAEVETENLKLKEKLDYYQSDQFTEEQIRNKLQMAKPEETVVILPEELSKEATNKAEIEEEETKELSNWQKWLQLFW